MKRFFIMIVSMVVIVSSKGQSDERQPKKMRYYQSVEVNILAKGRANIFGIGLGVSNVYGVKFNNHLALGFGLEFDYMYEKGCNVVRYIPHLGQEMAIDNYRFGNIINKSYLSFRYFILAKRKWSPLIMLNAGMTLSYTGFSSNSLKLFGSHGMWNLSPLFNMFVGADYKYKSDKSLFFGFQAGYDWPFYGTLKLGFDF